MPLFSWLPAFQLGWQIGQAIMDGVDPFDPAEAPNEPLSPDREALARLLAQRAAFEESEEAKLERSRWLEAHRAERTFPCGVVPEPVLDEADAADPVPAPPKRPLLPSDPGWAVPEVAVTAPPSEPRSPASLPAMQVLAAVLPEDLVFIREQGRTEEVEEVGRLPRASIDGIDVVDAGGTHVPEPARETLEPSEPVFTVLRWSNAGTPDEDRFLFRSPWIAWEAGHRLMAAKR
jgi:hypothetical protein